MEHAEIIKTEIKPSRISGQGRFATEDIARGEYIGTFTGDLCLLNALIERSEALGITEDDTLQVDTGLYLIPDPSSKIINHSCNPNAGVRNDLDLYAIRDIKAGEEITFDYSTTVGIDDDYEMNCQCGENICRRKIANILTLPAVTLARYMNLDALPNFIKRQLQSIGKMP